MASLAKLSVSVALLAGFVFLMHVFTEVNSNPPPRSPYWRSSGRGNGAEFARADYIARGSDRRVQQQPPVMPATPLSGAPIDPIAGAATAPAMPTTPIVVPPEPASAAAPGAGVAAATTALPPEPLSATHSDHVEAVARAEAAAAAAAADVRAMEAHLPDLKGSAADVHVPARIVHELEEPHSSSSAPNEGEKKSLAERTHEGNQAALHAVTSLLGHIADLHDDVHTIDRMAKPADEHGERGPGHRESIPVSHIAMEPGPRSDAQGVFDRVKKTPRWLREEEEDDEVRKHLKAAKRGGGGGDGRGGGGRKRDRDLDGIEDRAMDDMHHDDVMGLTLKKNRPGKPHDEEEDRGNNAYHLPRPFFAPLMGGPHEPPHPFGGIPRIHFVHPFAGHYRSNRRGDNWRGAGPSWGFRGPLGRLNRRDDDDGFRRPRGGRRGREDLEEAEEKRSGPPGGRDDDDKHTSLIDRLHNAVVSEPDPHDSSRFRTPELRDGSDHHDDHAPTEVHEPLIEPHHTAVFPAIGSPEDKAKAVAAAVLDHLSTV